MVEKVEKVERVEKVEKVEKVEIKYQYPFTRLLDYQKRVRKVDSKLDPGSSENRGRNPCC